MPNNQKLTARIVDRLKEPGIYWDTQEPGLGIRVSKNAKTWLYQRRVKGSGVERKIVLAHHGDPVLLEDGSVRSFPFGADDARVKASVLKGKMLAGIDPIAEEQQAAAEPVGKAEKEKALATTLQQVVDHYLEHHWVKGRPLRPKTKKDYREFMERHFADWLCEGPSPIRRGLRRYGSSRV